MGLSRSGPGPAMDLSTQAPAWYVAHIKPRQESRVLAHLRLRSGEIEPYSPRLEVVRRRWGRLATVLEPLFPNYLFLRMRLTPLTWTAARWSPGVRRLLSDGDLVAPVPDALVEAIRERASVLGFVRVGTALKLGQCVRVLGGPMAGLEGIFERHTSRASRVRVLMQILGHSTPVEVEEINLEAV
ncbi:MAG: transcription termination/antitermination NusG family protein [bacterium]|nr:transcription termination/antitermination NusG family protein [bacterium]